MTGRLLVLATALPLFIAGCLPPPAPPPEPTNGTHTTSSSPPPPATVCDGIPALDAPPEDAYSYAVWLVCDNRSETPQPRYRVPGTPGHADALQWLTATLEEANWTVRQDVIEGSEYAEMDKGSVAGYYEDGGYCSDADRQRLLGLTFTNVEAVRPGSGDGIVLLMAHWDSKRFATQDDKHPDQPVLGANDGASGVGVLLHLAHRWSEATFSTEVRILLTDGEDGFEDCHPLAGSIAYAEGMPDDERQRVEGILLLDMVGNADHEFMIAGNDAGLAKRLREIAATQEVPAIAEARDGGVFDDHTPFMERGMPAIDLIPRSFSQAHYWHTTEDTPDVLDADFMDDVAQVTRAWTEGF